MTIRPAQPGDSAAMAGIYGHYVQAGWISFELDSPTPEEMAKRMRAAGALYPWLVDEDGGAVTGFAYAGAFKTRAAYRFTVETTVYVDRHAHGRGIGKRLYATLLATLEEQGFTSAVASIALPNAASIALHASLGFHEVGVHRAVGYKHDNWCDVAQWQRPLAVPAVPPREPLSWLRPSHA